MVEAGSILSVPDIHAGPFTNGFQAFENLDIGGVVASVRVRGSHSTKNPCKNKLYHWFYVAMFHVKHFRITLPIARHLGAVQGCHKDLTGILGDETVKCFPGF